MRIPPDRSPNMQVHNWQFCFMRSLFLSLVPLCTPLVQCTKRKTKVVNSIVAFLTPYRYYSDVIKKALAQKGSHWKLSKVVPEWPRRGLPILEHSEKLLRTSPTEDHTLGFFVARFKRFREEDPPAQNELAKQTTLESVPNESTGEHTKGDPDITKNEIDETKKLSPRKLDVSVGIELPPDVSTSARQQQQHEHKEGNAQHKQLGCTQHKHSSEDDDEQNKQYLEPLEHK